MKAKCALFFAYAFLSVGLSLGGAYLHWVVCVKHQIVSPLVFTLLMLIISGGVAVFYFRLLNRFQTRWFHYFLVWLFLFVPMIASFRYVALANEQLKPLQSIKEIDSNKNELFVAISTCFVNKNQVGIYKHSHTTGRGGSYYVLNVNIVLPIYETASDTAGVPIAYLGFDFRKTIDNDLSEVEKKQAFNQLQAESTEQAKTTDFSKYNYFEQVKDADKKKHYISASKQIANYDLPILEGYTEPFEAKTKYEQRWSIGTILTGLAVWLVMLLLLKPKSEQ